MSVYDDLATPGEKPVEDGATTGDSEMGKGLLRSKTFWANALAAAVSIGTYLMDSDLLASNPEIVAIGGTVIGVLNVLLRLVTKEPINGVK